MACSGGREQERSAGEGVITPRLYPDYYRRLGVHRGMDEAWIHTFTRPLLMSAHPDRPTGDAVRFSMLSEARRVLSDETARNRYHEQLTLLAPWCTTCNSEGFKTQQAGFVRRKVYGCPTCGGSGFLLTDPEWDALEVRQ